MGAKDKQVSELAEIFTNIVLRKCSVELINQRAKDLRDQLSSPMYCFTAEQLRARSLLKTVEAIWRDQSAWLEA